MTLYRKVLCAVEVEASMQQLSCFPHAYHDEVLFRGQIWTFESQSGWGWVLSEYQDWAEFAPVSTLSRPQSVVLHTEPHRPVSRWVLHEGRNKVCLPDRSNSKHFTGTLSRTRRTTTDSPLLIELMAPGGNMFDQMSSLVVQCLCVGGRISYVLLTWEKYCTGFKRD